MKLTNKHGLPEPIVQAVRAFDQEYQDSHKAKSDISVTQLISPPQQVELVNRHWDEIEEDVADRIYALMGSAMHKVLEMADPDALTEHRFYADRNGWTISGQIDRYEDGVLSDYKNCSVWEHHNGLKVERVWQLNLLAWLMRENGYRVDKLEITAIYRDWSKPKARRGEHPERQVEVHPVTMMQEESILGLLDHLLERHQQARAGNVPHCTQEERWATETKYAVFKKGAKRATKPHTDPKEAADHAAKIGGYVEVRHGESKRCPDYCSAAPFCPQWAAISGAQGG